MDSDEDVEMVPAKAKAVKAPVEDVATDEEEDGEEDPDEYRVEKILKHDFDANGTVLYQIKWLGYEKKSDMTWEPVENLYAPTTPSSPHE
jgi:chromobox protein 1